MTNINKMSDFQYLDYNGLKIFLQQLKEYISNQIKAISGEDLKLYDSTDKENPTITSKIEDLQEVIGDSGVVDGSLAENIATILKQYVKDIQGENSENQIVSINVENDNGVYTISINDINLNQELINIKTDIETNAEVCATALTDLDKRLTQLSTDVETNELVCANALTNLNVRLKNVEAGVASSYNAGVLTIITSHNTETEEPDLESTTN